MNEILVGKQYRIRYDDGWHHVAVNGRFIRLSPTQYRIFRAQIDAPSPMYADEIVLVAYRSCHDLQEETNLPRQLLIKHISNLNTRLSRLGLEMRAFQAGYVLLFTSYLHRTMQ